MRSNVTRWIALLVLSSACARPSASALNSASEPAQALPPPDINFLSIVVDKETLEADNRLRKYVEQLTGAARTRSSRRARFPQQTMPYGDVIRAFAERDKSKAYLARITPYAYVAAEMLGAELEILATYKSAATRSMTYHSYFVVPKGAFKDPTAPDLVAYLRTLKDKPARFVYHDRFSTSSYFLPSLYFRTRHVFAMRQSVNDELVPIQVDRVPSTSSRMLVLQVANHDADLAAVWDGTKNRFERATDPADQAIRDEVLFIPIETVLPNDFLVASGLDPLTRDAIVEGMKENVTNAAGNNCRLDVEAPRCPDDFVSWHAWDGNDNQQVDAAREALARLRQLALERPAPVVVKVEAPAQYLTAAKEAVRLSGTEFVLEDQDLHKRVDMTWTLTPIHDGALNLTTKLDATFGAESEQQFPISFVDGSDLPRRIADLARSRFQRIRYVWPYENKYPTVLRDLDFTPDHNVLVQRISWMDPTRNEYEEDTPFRARIEDNTDFNKLRLVDELVTPPRGNQISHAGAKFPRSPSVDGSFNFEPMSNVAYRVIIAREPHPGWIWVVLPYCFIGMFLLSLTGLVVDLRRGQPPPKGLQQTYQRMVAAYHRSWRNREIEEGDILWSDPAYADELVKELKTEGSFLDLARAGSFDFDIGPIPIRFSVLLKLLSPLELTPFGEGRVLAFDRLVRFLVRRRRLSPFIGFPEPADVKSKTPAWPIEWQALNDIASRHFSRLGIGHKRKQMNADLSPQNGALSAVVSSHFRAAIKKGTHDASLFRQTWTVGENGASGRLVWEHDMRSALPLGSEHSQARRVRLEVALPPDAALTRSPESTELKAWVLGKIITSSVEQDTLSLKVRPMAVLRDHAHQH